VSMSEAPQTFSTEHSGGRFRIVERSPEHAMISQQRRWKWIVLGSLLVLPLVVLWSLPSAPPPVRVTFQHLTNDPATGRVGVIKLVHNRHEPVLVMHGWSVHAT